MKRTGVCGATARLEATAELYPKLDLTPWSSTLGA
jgi:hypothetical protein